MDRSPKRAARDVVAEDRWRQAVADRIEMVASGPVEDLPRFVESRRPLAALAKVVRRESEQGCRIVPLGHQRDLRVLGSRVAAALQRPVAEADGFAGIGPSQLHQLRGRVGRGSRRGHILLLTHDGDRGSGGRNHRRAPAQEGHGDRDGDRRVEADTRIDAGDDREADCLGNECQRTRSGNEKVRWSLARHERGTSRCPALMRTCVVGHVLFARRIGDRDSHPGLHRVLAVARQ